jgi:hypothetical protein
MCNSISFKRKTSQLFLGKQYQRVVLRVIMGKVVAECVGEGGFGGRVKYLHIPEYT